MNIDCFVLIGGRSSRLGRDKATVELGGMTLAGRAVKTIRMALAPERVIFIARNTAHFDTNVLCSDTPAIFDLVEHRGPLGGLYTAVSNARSRWIFVLACDYPFVSPDLIKLLGSMVTDEFGAVAPEQSDGRIQPLCAFYKTETTRELVAEVLDRPRVPPPLHVTLRDLFPRIVKYDEYTHLPDADKLFINVNTVDDLGNALEMQDSEGVN